MMNAIDSIKQFKSLLDEGVITQEDYEAKKKELLTNGKDKGDPIDLLKAYKELLDSDLINKSIFIKSDT